MFIALLVVGPQRLPRLASQAGTWIGRIKRLANNFKQDLSRELDTPDVQKTIGASEEELEKLGSSLKRTGKEVQRDIRNLDPLVKTLDEEIKSGRFKSDPHDDSNNRSRDAGA